MLVDTHAHLDLSAFDADREDVIRRAADAGVGIIIDPGIHLESSRAAIRLAEAYDAVYAAVGIHPHDSATFDERSIDALAELAEHPKVVAIGEIGLDFYRDYAAKSLQEQAFRMQLHLARERDLPVIIHSRAAEDRVLEILREEHMGGGRRKGRPRGVLHCFGGTLDQAKTARRMGFLVGIAGPVTYRGSDRLALGRGFVIDNILIETDAPYLAPAPHRGQRNEPAFIRLVAEKLAEPGPFTLDDVERITTHAARALFRIGESDPTRIAYAIRDSLYLNITNRCTLSCTFCPKSYGEFTVKGHSLALEREPTVEEIMAAVGDVSRWREIVFCGFGETTLRFETMKEVARRLRALGVTRIRLDTDGLANFVHERDVTPELAGLVDAVSVSLNAPDPATYVKLVRPGKPGDAFGGVQDFIRRVKRYVPDVTATVVGLPNLDVEACRRIAEDELGVKFRVREYDVVG